VAGRRPAGPASSPGRPGIAGALAEDAIRALAGFCGSRFPDVSDSDLGSRWMRPGPDGAEELEWLQPCSPAAREVRLAGQKYFGLGR
jgi:hypothetical protein